MESRSHGLREMSIRTAGRGRASARPRTGTWRRFRGDPTIRPLRAHNSIGSRSRSSESRCTGNSAFSASTANGESPRTTQRLELTTGTRSAASPSSPSTGTNLYLSCASLETCDAAKDDHPFRWDDADMPRPVDFRYEDVVGFTSRGEVYIRLDVALPDASRRAFEAALAGHVDGAQVRRSIVNLNHPALVEARAAAVDSERVRIKKDFEDRTATRDERDERATQLLDRDSRPAFVSIRVAWLRKRLGRGR